MPHATTTRKPRAVDIQKGADAILDVYRADGCVIIKNFLSQAQVKEINVDIDAELYKIKPGSTLDDEVMQNFHGANTRRMANLVTHSKLFRECILNHEMLHSICEKTYREDAGDYWMSTAQVVEIGPGNKAQPLHRDIGPWPVFLKLGPDGPECIINFFLALTKFTDQNGATRCIPGSHTDEDLTYFGKPEDTVPAEMEAGDIFMMTGKLIHGGGANQTTDFYRRAIGIAMVPAYLTPEESYPFILDLNLVRKMPQRAQKMIGFRSVLPANCPAFLWQHNFTELATHLGL